MELTLKVIYALDFFLYLMQLQEKLMQQYGFVVEPLVGLCFTLILPKQDSQLILTK